MIRAFVLTCIALSLAGCFVGDDKMARGSEKDPFTPPNMTVYHWCVDGVMYVGIYREITVAYNRDGTVKTCETKK